MANIAFDMSTPIFQRIPLKPSGEVIIPLIDSIYNDKPTKDYEINVPRIGSITKSI